MKEKEHIESIRELIDSGKVNKHKTVVCFFGDFLIDTSVKTKFSYWRSYPVMVINDKVIFTSNRN